MKPFSTIADPRDIRKRINVLFDELLHGHMWDEQELREVLGHTPLEVAGGILLGLVVAIVMWLVWK